MENIKTSGLQPSIGKLSRDANEPLAAVYLFPDLPTLEDALAAWLGDSLDNAYGDDCPMVILQVNLPPEQRAALIPGAGFELLSLTAIPPSYISFYDENMNPLDPK